MYSQSRGIISFQVHHDITGHVVSSFHLDFWLVHIVNQVFNVPVGVKQIQTVELVLKGCYQTSDTKVKAEQFFCKVGIFVLHIPAADRGTPVVIVCICGTVVIAEKTKGSCLRAWQCVGVDGTVDTITIFSGKIWAALCVVFQRLQTIILQGDSKFKIITKLGRNITRC